MSAERSVTLTNKTVFEGHGKRHVPGIQRKASPHLEIPGLAHLISCYNPLGEPQTHQTWHLLAPGGCSLHRPN